MPRGEPLDGPARSSTGVSADQLDLREPIDAVAQAFVAGGPDALRTVYDAYAPLVFTFCRRALGPERAADATQDVFTDVWRNRQRFDATQGHLRGWVMGIAKHKVLGILRHDGARATTPLFADGPEREAAPSAEIDLMADRMVLAQALNTLPDRTRKLSHLSYMDGLSHSEIAERTGLPLGSVKSDIRRGLQRLRVDLGSPA